MTLNDTEATSSPPHSGIMCVPVLWSVPCPPACHSHFRSTAPATACRGICGRLFWVSMAQGSPQSRAALGAPLARPCTEQHLPPQQPQHWADQSQLFISALPRGFLVPGTSFPALCQLRKPQRWPALNDIVCLLYIHLHTSSEGAQIKDDA